MNYASRQSLKRKESDLLSAVKRFLNLVKGPDSLSFRRIHTVGIPSGKNSFRPNLDMLGMSDLQIYMKGGATLHIELKGPKGKLTPHQEKFRDELHALGHYYYCIQSLDELIQVLNNHSFRHWSTG